MSPRLTPGLVALVCAVVTSATVTTPVALAGSGLPSVQASSGGPRGPCATGNARAPVVRRPSAALAWRVQIPRRVSVYARPPTRTRRPMGWVTPGEATWLLVLGARHGAKRGCQLRVRLPGRPNGAAGWLGAGADALRVQATPWRIVVSLSRRTVTLLHAGRPALTASAVVGKPSTPTPTGLFAITEAVPWHPNAFVGSWVLALTAHSDVLRAFDGGDGTVGIHGRGGASLADPLGSARSHGCIRLANATIDRLVARVGRAQLVGTPVQVGR
jgi:hypothetical protein